MLLLHTYQSLHSKKWKDVSAEKEDVMFAKQGGVEACSPVFLAHVDFHVMAAGNM